MNFYEEFNLRIEIYGGRDKLAKDIEDEWCRNNNNYWTLKDVSILINNINNIDAITEKTGKSFYSVSNKINLVKKISKRKGFLNI